MYKKHEVYSFRTEKAGKRITVPLYGNALKMEIGQ